MAKVNGGNGFKETEVGDIPQEWEVAQLADICGLRTETVDPNTLSHVRYVGLEHIESGNPRLAQWGDCGQVKSSKNKFYPGDILYGKLRPYLRKSALAHFEGISSTDILILKADTARTMPDWLIHLFHTRGFVEHAISTTGGTNLPRTSWKAIREYRLALPPLPEQRGIAHVLSTIQRAMAAQEAVIAAAREVKRSLMRRLFTYGPYADPLPTRETEIGEVPEHWKIVQLGDLARIGNGSTPKRDNPSYWENGDIPWLTSTKVHESVITHADEFVTATAKAECHLPLVSKGSLVVAITGQGKTLGNAALVTFDTCINQHLAYIEFKDKNVLPEFMLLFLQGRYQHLRQIGQSGGSTKGALTCGFLKGYAVPVPPTDEQRQIAVSLGTLGQKLKVEEQRKAALQALFKSMLHELMTGKVRVAQHGL